MSVTATIISASETISANINGYSSRISASVVPTYTVTDILLADENNNFVTDENNNYILVGHDVEPLPGGITATIVEV